MIECVFPSLSNWLYNRRVREKIEKEANLDTPNAKVSPVNLTKESLKELYDNDLHIKDKLEDKAKTNVIGVTISVTLIMGAYSLLQNISERHGIGALYCVAFALFVCAVVYMLAAGIHAIHVLTAENEIYTASFKPEDDQYNMEDLNKVIGLNRAKNTLRNNYVFTSYECIRNALICLFAVMLIAIIPVQNCKDKAEYGRYENYYLSSNAMQTIHDGVDLPTVTDYIESQPRSENTFNVVDDKDRLFIKYTIEADKTIIHLIEPY